MLAKIQKWGNSLAIRIPKAFTSEIRMEKDSAVEISLVDKQIIIKAVGAPRYSLKQLLSGINANNIHSETDTGFAAGKEVC